MSKEKVGIGSILIHMATYHPWLKLISFLLAIITWFYAKGEITL